MRRFLVLFVAALAACGSEGTAGPKGAPAVVVKQAADRTLAAAEADVVVTGPDGARTDGTLSPPAGGGRLTVVVPGRPPRSVPPGAPPADLPEPVRRFEYTDPLAVVALLRGATAVDPYGGVEVRGVGTLRYDLELDADVALASAPPAQRAALEAAYAGLGGQRSFFANVFVDSRGRARRIEVPEDRTDRRPRGRERGSPPLIVVELVSFR